MLSMEDYLWTGRGPTSSRSAVTLDSIELGSAPAPVERIGSISRTKRPVCSELDVAID